MGLFTLESLIQSLKEQRLLVDVVGLDSSSSHELVRATTLAGIFTDSRNIPLQTSQSSGESLGVHEVYGFLALKGKHFDGHEAIHSLMSQNQIKIFLGDQECPLQHQDLEKNKCIYIKIKNSADSRAALAHWWRHQFSVPIIAVCGSVGKTTTKELLVHGFTKLGLRIHKTEASQNGYDGIPETLLKLRRRHHGVVLEIGIDEPLAMDHHLKTAHPTHVVISALGPEHLEKLKTEQIAISEELKSVDYVLHHGGVAVVNADHPITQEWLKKNKLPPKDHNHHLIITQTQSLPENLEHHPGLQQFSKAALKCLVSVLAFFESQGESFRLDPSSFTSFIQPTGRGQWKKLVPNQTKAPKSTQDVLVYYDLYNSNPTSLREALSEVSEKSQQEKRPLILVLGDMRELGQQELQYHEDLLPYLPKQAQVFLLGPCMKSLFELAASSRFFWFQQIEDLYQKLQGSLSDHLEKTGDSPGPLLLIKGSRGMKLERVYENLLGSFQEKVSL